MSATTLKGDDRESMRLFGMTQAAFACYETALIRGDDVAQHKAIRLFKKYRQKFMRAQAEEERKLSAGGAL
jgi:hypothetical protein